MTIYSSSTTDQVLAATQQFSESNTDPKAQLITTLDATALGAFVFVIFFYDGPDPGSVFSMFDSIDATVNLVTTQTFYSFILELNSAIATSPRGSFNTLPTTTTTLGFLNAISNQTTVNAMTLRYSHCLAFCESEG